MSNAPTINAQAETSPSISPGLPQPGANGSAPAKAPDNAKDASEAEQIKVQTASEDEFLTGNREKEANAPPIWEWRRMRQVARRYVGEELSLFTSQFTGSVHIGGGDVHYTFYGFQQQLRQQPHQQHDRGYAVERIAIGPIEKTRLVYVAPPIQQQALDLFREKHVLVLMGDVYAGKRTAALQFLSTVHPGTIFELSPCVDLEDELAFKIEGRRGYLIDSLPPAAGSKLSAFTLQRLSSRLKAQHSHLVITLDSRIFLAKETLSDYLLPWKAPLDGEQILARHLAWYFKDGPSRQEVATYCADSDIRQRVANSPPRKIARLAESLAGAIREELPLEQALEDNENDAREQAASRFKQQSLLERRTFMLALAVFNGTKYQYTVDADESLRKLVQPPLIELLYSEQPNIPTVFDTPRSDVLNDTGASIEHAYEFTPLGPAPIERIKFNNPSFQKMILQCVWEEYPGLRYPLLTWLRDLGANDDMDIQHCVAAALGYLSRYDFRMMQKEVLLPWSKAAKRSIRQEAALALGILAWDDRFAPLILDRLHQWSIQRDDWRLCWTATLAHGLLVGWRFPREALVDIYLIAQMRDPRLFDAIWKSVFVLFTLGQDIPEYYYRVLDALEQWTRPPRSRPVAIWLHIFLKIAYEATEPPRADGPAWPAVLRVACVNQTYRLKILALWQRALSIHSARALALEGDTPVLCEWLHAADGNAEIYAAVEQLIGDLMAQADTRERDRLDFYFKRWATDPFKPCESAARLRAFIGNGL